MRPLLRCRLVGACAAVLALAACGPGAAPRAIGTSAPSSSEEPTSSAPATTTAPASATVPPVGSTLTALSGGTVVPNSAGQGFSVLVRNSSGGDVDSSTLTTYDVAGRVLTTLTAGSGFSGSCGVDDIVSTSRRIVVGETITTQPAQGINPAQYSAGLSAFDGTTGQKLWTTQVVQPQAQQLSCGSSDGGLSDLQTTADGAWGAMIVDDGDLAVGDAIDLATGQLYPKADLQGALGKQLVTGGGQSSGGSGKLFVFALPPAWQGLGSFSSGQGPGLVDVDGPGEVTTGLFPRGAGAGLSTDGTVLYAAQRTESNNHSGTQLTAYSLPAMTQVWRQDTTNQSVTYDLLGAGGGTVVVQRQGPDGTTTDGLDAKTGSALWTLPKVDSICGLSSTQMLVQANGQTAVIDLATGKQVSYSGPSTGAGFSSSCPTVLPGGIAVQNQTVVQALQP